MDNEELQLHESLALALDLERVAQSLERIVEGPTGAETMRLVERLGVVRDLVDRVRSTAQDLAPGFVRVSPQRCPKCDEEDMWEICEGGFDWIMCRNGCGPVDRLAVPPHALNGPLLEVLSAEHVVQLMQGVLARYVRAPHI